MDHGVDIAVVGPDDWKAWREIRLRALRDAPGAFGSSYERERERTEAGWRERLAAPGVLMIAADGAGGAEALGIVGAYPTGQHETELISMWVAPEARGRGIAAQLVGAVFEWSAERGARSVTLWVADGNDGAEALYGRLGFERTGAAQRLASNPEVDEFEMRVALAARPGTPDLAPGTLDGR